MLVAERHENERLRQIIREMQRYRFGRRAESLPDDQLLLGLEEAEQGVAADEAEREEAAPVERAARSVKHRTNRGSLPAHLPRIEMVVDIDDRACPCCREALHRIGEDVSERLDIVPALFRHSEFVIRPAVGSGPGRPSSTVTLGERCRVPESGRR